MAKNTLVLLIAQMISTGLGFFIRDEAAQGSV
jgi:hypothetical protein